MMHPTQIEKIMRDEAIFFEQEIAFVTDIAQIPDLMSVAEMHQTDSARFASANGF